VSTSSIVSSLGAGSGIDVSGLVESLVEVERAAPQERIDSKKETLETQISAYGTLKSALSTLEDSISALTNNDVFHSRSASVPDTDMFVANALDANAQTGTFQIGVEALAQSQTLVANQTFAEKDSSLNMSGNLTIQLGEWAYDGSDNPTGFTANENATAINIEISEEDTLQDIADKINAAEGNVQASVLKVDGSYQLMMNAPSGASNALEITADDPSLSALTYNASDFSNMTETLKGQDSEITINGLSVFRDTNEIDDVIQGLDFSLSKASPGETVAFTISEDKSTAEDEIRNFVDAYNTFYETAKSLTGISTDSDTEESVAGTLSTDGTAKAMLSQVRSLMTASVEGVEGGFNALTNLGIRTQLDGTLEIIEDEFSDALENNFDQIESIFSPQTSSSSSGITVGMGRYSGQAVPGTYDVSITTPAAKGYVTADAAFSSFTTVDLLDYSFSVEVDGVETESLSISGTFSSAQELASTLQSLINEDENVKSAGFGVDVLVDESGVMSIVSREFGSSSGVSFTAASTEFANATNFSTASVATAGTDVAGTIKGEAAFGSGNILLPPVGSDAYGLNLTIAVGLTGDHSFNFSRGLASEMTKLIDNFLDDSTGAIAMREDNMNTQLDNLEDDQVDLDRRISMYEERLTAQFTAMEAIIASFQSTGDSVASLFDTLPYTSSNN
jgi:flagellar hook-associated protein 2